MAISLLAVAAKKVKDNQREDIVPLMGVMGAFVFAAQMINFTIPGTGSSGHLIGGILLSALLGPWCAFITLSTVLIIQCLVFADGGILAMGCNILNMAATSCLIAYPLIYRPITKNSNNRGRITIASILSSIVALEIGAFGVTLETEVSGITALPFSTFIKFMLPIHLVIGLVEGIVTAALLVFVSKYRPELLQTRQQKVKSGKLKPFLLGIVAVTFLLGGSFTLLASQYPDGLEWSIDKVAGIENFTTETPPTALIPEYDSSFAGIIGALIVMAIIWGLSSLVFSKMRKKSKETELQEE